MTKKLQSKKSGFTLVELIVVIAILGILAAITIPRFSQYVQNAKDTALDANAKTVYNACAAAETKLIADNAKPGATVKAVDADSIVAAATNSLSGVTLESTGKADTNADNTFQLSAYTPTNSSTGTPSSFTIKNVTASGTFTWTDGGARTTATTEPPTTLPD